MRPHLLGVLLIATVGLRHHADLPGKAEECGLHVISQRAPEVYGSVSLSADGRYLAFASFAPLVAQDTNGRSDIYVFDAVSRRVTLESAMPDGSPGNSDSYHPDISDDGRLLIFDSSGALVSDSTPLVGQVLLRDRETGTTRVVSRNGAGELGSRGSGPAVISADGQVVAFESAASNLVAGNDENGIGRDIYTFHVSTGTIARVSVTGAGRQLAVGASFSPTISADGLRIAFTSSARLTDDVPSSHRRLPSPLEGRHVFVRDLARGNTHRVSRSKELRSSYFPAMSHDGRWLAFVSEASDLVQGDANRAPDVFLSSLEASTTTLVSRSASGGSANGASARPSISADGRLIAFESVASNLVCAQSCPARDADINLVADVFVLDRIGGAMTRLTADAESGWMEASRGPVIAALGNVIAFSSRRPMDDRDRGDDFDLFVRKCARPLPRSASWEGRMLLAIPGCLSCPLAWTRKRSSQATGPGNVLPFRARQNSTRSESAVCGPGRADRPLICSPP